MDHSAEIENSATRCTVRSSPAAVLAHHFKSATLDVWDATVNVEGAAKHGITFSGQATSTTPVTPTPASDGVWLKKVKSAPLRTPIEFDPAQRTIQSAIGEVEIVTDWILGSRTGRQTKFLVTFDVLT